MDLSYTNTTAGQIAERQPAESRKRENIICLHIELFDCLLEEQQEILKKYAGSSTGYSISRDVLIPEGFTLHALHYCIQRLFGWKNSHPRHFSVDSDTFEWMTSGKFTAWASLCGIYFLCWGCDDESLFWDDDFMDHQNYKLWLCKRYTKPFIYRGGGELYQENQKEINLIRKNFPLIKVMPPFNPYEVEDRSFVKISPLDDLTLEELSESITTEQDMNCLLERLAVTDILLERKQERCLHDDWMEKLYDSVMEEIDSRETGNGRPATVPVAGQLLYHYDYGDNWKASITREDFVADSRDDMAKELGERYPEAGLEWLSVIESVKKHTPVCVKADGIHVLDDVGGMTGFCSFLMNLYENPDRYERKNCREWAEKAGWSSRRINLKNML